MARVDRQTHFGTFDFWVTSPKGAKTRISYIFSTAFPYIWPLAGPNIEKKGGPLPKTARVHRQTHFGTFNFWIKPGFWCKKGLKALKSCVFYLFGFGGLFLA